MPAKRLGMGGGSVGNYDVIGIDAVDAEEFVGHVGLASRDRSGTGELAMIHMAPPLRSGDPADPINCVGTVPLTAGEASQVALFIDNLEGEYQSARIREGSDQYCIAPHVRPRKSADGTVVCLRFSCGGFVIEAYRSAGIVLLATDDASLPPVPLGALIRQYPRYANLLGSARVRGRFGLEGDGPWPVVLAGYVINALGRAEGEIRSGPYLAAAGDEFFPPHRAEPQDPDGVRPGV